MVDKHYSHIHSCYSEGCFVGHLLGNSHGYFLVYYLALGEEDYIVVGNYTPPLNQILADYIDRNQH